MKPTSAEAVFFRMTERRTEGFREHDKTSPVNVMVLLFFLKQFYDFDTTHFVEFRIQAGNCELLPVKWSPGH